MEECPKTLIEEAIQEELHPRPAYDMVIPGYIRVNDNLSWQQKTLYALLRNLCSLKGYCWATNIYLAHQMDVDERTIKRWIAILSKEQVLSSQIISHGMKKRRRIWLAETLKFKKVIVGTSVSPPSGHSCHHGRDKNVPYTEERDTEEKKLSPPTPSKGDERDLLLNDCEYMDMALAFWDHLQRLHPEHEKPNLAEWQETFRKASKKRYIPLAELRTTLKWMSESDGFWRSRISSPHAFLQKYDKIRLAMTHTSKAQAKQTHADCIKENIETVELWKKGEADFVRLLGDYVQNSITKEYLQLDIDPAWFKIRLRDWINDKKG